ncbi:MAG: peptidase [Gemmatimonadetes bacterium]|nr:peptidase [Gemmatimonadota bacterium]
MRRFPLGLAAVAAACLSVTRPLAAQQAQDTAYARLIRETTTDPKFLPASVASLPASASVPSPKDFFGTIVGAPGVMHHTSELYAYYRALAKATPRVRVETMGKTEEGRELLLVIVADESDMGKLDQYRAAMARLADPRQTSAEQVAAVMAGVKPFYYLNGGLHSPEMGSPEMLMELAYRLAVSEEPAIKRIRDNLVVLINPVAEPDGRDKQVDWYLRYTKGRPEWDDGFPRSTPYWGRYIVHDNNRDGLQISAALTRAIFKAYYDWHPLVMHDLHESVPLLYISTGTGPYNEHNDPIIISEWQLLANNDINALNAEGLPGVWTWGFFDGWWPGYGMWVANNHNSIGRFYETFGNAGADTYVRDLSDAKYANEPVTARTWYRTAPPTKKVRWSARDNVNYMEAGVLASLGFVADRREEFLRNFWQVGYNSLRRGLTETPHAYVIPDFARQRDSKMVAYLINQLQRQKIEIQQRVTGDSAGDFVILLNQPYRDLAVNLLSKQNYPSTAQYPPYDDIAWTLQYLYGVDVQAVDDTAVFHWTGLKPLTDTVAATATVIGDGSHYYLAYRAQAEVLSALYWLRSKAPKAAVFQAEASFEAGGETYPAGSLVFERMPPEVARELAARFALPLRGFPDSPPVKQHRVDLPRVAIYHTWYSTQDEGWARYTFDRRGIPYTSIDKDDLRRGGLRDRFDVILVPNANGSVEQWIHEIDKKWGPIPYQKSKETPNLGTPASTPDLTGGPGFEGLAELERFVEQGGDLITLAGATRLAAETGIARPLEPHPTRQLFHPGSVVRAKALRPDHPVLYGYPETPIIFKGNGPLYQVEERDKGMVVLQYGTKVEEEKDEGAMLGIPAATASAGPRVSAEGAKAAPAADSAAKAPTPPSGGAAHDPAQKKAGEKEDAYVVSGMVRGQDEIIGQGAIFDVPVGEGRVLAFTFNPLHRFLSHATFPMVWNALMNWNDLPPVPAKPAAGAVAAGQK